MLFTFDIYRLFAISINQIKNIKALIIWHNSAGSQRKYIQM